MKKTILSEDQRYYIIGKLFFDLEVFNSLQMNVIQSDLKKYEKSYTESTGTPFVNISAWDFYNILSISIKESRPATWMDDQIALHMIFNKVIDFPLIVSTTEPTRDESEPDGEVMEIEASMGVEKPTDGCVVYDEPEEVVKPTAPESVD